VRRSVSFSTEGLKIKHLLPVIERFPDLRYGNSNGYVTLYFEEGPEHPIIPEPITREESAARQFVQAVEREELDPKVVFLPGVWAEYKRLAKEYQRKADVNYKAGRADAEHEGRLVEEVRQIIRDAQDAESKETE